MPILHPMTPFIYSVHTQWPLFPLCIIFYMQIANFHVLRAWKLQIFMCFAHFEKFNNFAANFNIKFANFDLKLHFCTLNDPQFWESTPKKTPFFFFFFLVPTPNDPLFRQNLTPNTPCFHSLVGTCKSLSYLSAPAPPAHALMQPWAGLGLVRQSEKKRVDLRPLYCFWTWGGTGMSRGYQARPKIHVIRVVFQDQALYVRTSFRGAKTCKIGKKGVFLVI